MAKKWERIEQELNKCELVCANCHLIRTNSRIPLPVDNFEYAKLKTHCKQGHEYSEENTYIHKITGHRACKECRKNASLRHSESRKKKREIENGTK